MQSKPFNVAMYFHKHVKIVSLVVRKLKILLSNNYRKWIKFTFSFELGVHGVQACYKDCLGVQPCLVKLVSRAKSFGIASDCFVYQN